ncbi:MAG: hypothetical protein ACK56I_20300, partial [bacterium]
EGLERRHGLALDRVRREAARRRDELEQVLGARVAAFGFFRAIVLEQAARVQHLVHEFVQGEATGIGGQPVDQRREPLPRRCGLGAEAAAGAAGRGGAPERRARVARM